MSDTVTPLAASFMPIAASTLDNLPVLAQGATDDLKVELRDSRFDTIDSPVTIRYWVSRMTRADGSPFDREVTVEVWRFGVMVDSFAYEGGA